MKTKCTNCHKDHINEDDGIILNFLSSEDRSLGKESIYSGTIAHECSCDVICEVEIILFAYPEGKFNHMDINSGNCIVTKKPDGKILVNKSLREESIKKRYHIFLLETPSTGMEVINHGDELKITNSERKLNRIPSQEENGYGSEEIAIGELTKFMERGIIFANKVYMVLPILTYSK